MKKILVSTCISVIATAVVFVTSLQAGEDVVVPAKISAKDISGKIFERPDMLETKHDDGHVTLDVTTLLSSDKKFASGMYRSGKVRFEITEPYGVDQFMYFLEGGVTLTSADGSVQIINAGEGVTIAKEWTGIWDTDGYTSGPTRVALNPSNHPC